MIARLASFLLILWALGFAWFAVTLGKPARANVEPTQAIVVLTGGKYRIEHAAELLGQGKAERLLIAGADPSVRKEDLTRRLGGKRNLAACCIDLGSESVDTRSNADEARRWLERRHYTSLRVVTSDWHMRRARYEFRHTLGSHYRIVFDAVKTEPGLMTLFAEYNKYLLRRMSVWLDL
jgi:uncharacterized SAM-binding protein YcdF (DUF218 family)